MPRVTGWLQHNVWMQHSGLIFKGHMSSDDGSLKLRTLHCLQMSCTIHPVTQSYKTSASFFNNGKAWWYSSIYFIHSFCDSFKESLKLSYMLALHFILLFVQWAMFNFYEHYRQTVHYSIFALIWWQVAMLEIRNRKCNKVQSKLKRKKHFLCTLHYLWMTLTA